MRIQENNACPACAMALVCQRAKIRAGKFALNSCTLRAVFHPVFPYEHELIEKILTSDLSAHLAELKFIRVSPLPFHGAGK